MITQPQGLSAGINDQPTHCPHCRQALYDKCPVCQGIGTISSYQQDQMSSSVTEPCWRCKGTGKIKRKP